jgi:hypothetical protein
MSATLFDAYTTYCFYGCDHVVVDVDPVKSNDTMERHYWDNHYTQQDRDTLRAAGQPASRVGVKS